MFAKVAVFLFASCAVTLARPQDALNLGQASNLFQPQLPDLLQKLNPAQALNALPAASNAAQALNPLNSAQPLNPLQTFNAAQTLNPTQALQAWNLLQTLNPNLLQGATLNQLQALNPSQLQQLVSSALNLGRGNANTQYQSPILEVPNNALDWSQKVVDSSVNRVGSALGQAYDNTERVANNVVDTVSEVGKRSFQDGATLVKTGLGLFGTLPRIGFGLLSRNNNNGLGL